MEAEVPLGGGRVTDGVVRVGDTVRRATGPWTPTVHAYLGHLERRGFAGAPRVLGIDERGREILTYIEGEVASSSSWQRGHATPLPAAALRDESLDAVGRLVRELHDAARGFVPSEPRWREHAHAMLADEIVCHGDLGPHNTVYRDGEPVAFIDWDGARPNDPLLELGQVAWWFVPLAGDAYCEEMGFAEPPDRAARLGVLAGAYGVARSRLVELAREARQRDAERLRYWPMTAATSAGFLRQIASELDWLAANEAALRR